MTSDTPNRTEACALVFSEIIHTRHGHPAHHLQKAGFSILIDLDRLDEAHNASWFFSVNKFNIVSFHETDFGPNHKSQRKANEPKIKLSDHIRKLASQYFKADEITKIEMLAFPRILGLSCNTASSIRFVRLSLSISPTMNASQKPILPWPKILMIALSLSRTISAVGPFGCL